MIYCIYSADEKLHIVADISSGLSVYDWTYTRDMINNVLSDYGYPVGVDKFMESGFVDTRDCDNCKVRFTCMTGGVRPDFEAVSVGTITGRLSSGVSNISNISRAV